MHISEFGKLQISPLLTALRKCASAPVLCIIDTQGRGNFLSREEIEWLDRTDAMILYGNKADLQAQLDAVPAFDKLKPVSAIVSDFAEIDRAYGQAQDIARAIVGDLIDELDRGLRSEILSLRETIALQAADYFAPILLIHMALHRIVPDLATRPILLGGRNVRSGYGLQALLT